MRIYKKKSENLQTKKGASLKMSNYEIETKCIQSGWEPQNGEPRIMPIVQSTTFKYGSSDEMGALFDLEKEGYFYSRLANPTNDWVAKKYAIWKADMPLCLQGPVSRQTFMQCLTYVKRETILLVHQQFMAVRLIYLA